MRVQLKQKSINLSANLMDQLRRHNQPSKLAKERDLHHACVTKSVSVKTQRLQGSTSSNASSQIAYQDKACKIARKREKRLNSVAKFALESYLKKPKLLSLNACQTLKNLHHLINRHAWRKESHPRIVIKIAEKKTQMRLKSLNLSASQLSKSK